MSTNLTPILINETQARQSRDVITATEWNRLFNLLVAQGNDSQEKIQGLVAEYLTNAVLDSGTFDDDTKTISLKDGEETILTVDITHTHSDISNAIFSLVARITSAEGAINANGATIAQIDQAAISSAAISTDGGYTLNFYTRDGSLKSSISLAPLVSLINGKYEKPIGGIPLADLSSPVVTSLGKADTALQPSIIKNSLSSATDEVPTNYAVSTALENKANKSSKYARTVTFSPGTTTASVSVNGITSNSKIIVDLDLSNVSTSEITSIETEWAKVYRAYTSTDSVTFVAKSTPSVSFNVTILEVY